MRHRVHKKTFNRDTKARRSLLLGVTTAVLIHGEIITTKAKGKEAARFVDRAISKAKRGDLAARRSLHRMFGRRDVVNNLCDRVAPVFAGRQSGFTRLTFVGNRRGDNTPLYRLSLVEVLPLAEKREVKVTAAKKQSHDTVTHDDKAAQDAVKADTKRSQKTGRLSKLVERRKAAGKSMSVSGGGRGK